MHLAVSLFVAFRSAKGRAFAERKPTIVARLSLLVTIAYNKSASPPGASGGFHAAADSSAGFLLLSKIRYAHASKSGRLLLRILFHVSLATNL